MVLTVPKIVQYSVPIATSIVSSNYGYQTENLICTYVASSSFLLVPKMSFIVVTETCITFP